MQLNAKERETMGKFEHKKFVTFLVINSSLLVFCRGGFYNRQVFKYETI